MGIARTGGPLVYSQLNAGSRSQFVDGLVDRLTRANWAIDSTISGGYVLRGTSPQSTGAANKTMLLKVADTGATSLIGDLQATVQVISDVNPLVLSTPRHMKVFSGAKYRVVAGPCQFEVFRHGVADDVYGSTVCGGVPYLPPTIICQGTVPGAPATEAWWIVSDDINIGSSISHPRVSLMASGPSHNAVPPNYAEACWNGTFQPVGPVGQWQLLPIKGYQPWGFFASFGLPLGPAIWPDGAGLTIEPLMAWGGAIRGLAWDSRINTKSQTMDTVETDGDDRFLNFTDGYFWGSWQLLLPPLTDDSAENVTY